MGRRARDPVPARRIHPDRDPRCLACGRLGREALPGLGRRSCLRPRVPRPVPAHPAAPDRRRDRRHGARTSSVPARSRSVSARGSSATGQSAGIAERAAVGRTGGRQCTRAPGEANGRPGGSKHRRWIGPLNLSLGTDPTCHGSSRTSLGMAPTRTSNVDALRIAGSPVAAPRTPSRSPRSWTGTPMLARGRPGDNVILLSLRRVEAEALERHVGDSASRRTADPAAPADIGGHRIARRRRWVSSFSSSGRFIAAQPGGVEAAFRWIDLRDTSWPWQQAFAEHAADGPGEVGRGRHSGDCRRRSTSVQEKARNHAMERSSATGWPSRVTERGAPQQQTCWRDLPHPGFENLERSRFSWRMGVYHA